MLADSLGRHPHLYMFPFESKVIPLYLRRSNDMTGAHLPAQEVRRLADEIGRTLPFWRSNDRKPLRVPDESIAGVHHVGNLFQAIFLHLARSHGKLGWVEKTPGNVEHIALLSRAFPESKFIHIIRDGRDAAQSFHRRWWFDPRHTIWRWKHSIHLGRSAGQALGPGRYLELRYEDLTADPERWMRRACAFISVPFDEVVIGSSMRHMDARHDAARSGAIVPNSGRWEAYFSERTVRSLERLSGRTLDDLGYPVTVLGDDDLSTGARWILRIKDAVMRSLSFFRDRGLQGLPMYMRLLKNAIATRSVRRY